MRASRSLPALCVLFAAAFVFTTDAAAQTTRHYYVAAEKVTWDFAPTGENQIHGGPIPRPWRNHTRYQKVRYIEYTDDTFTTKKPQPEWLGVLGPIIRAEVGDTIMV